MATQNYQKLYDVLKQKGVKDIGGSADELQQWVASNPNNLNAVYSVLQAVGVSDIGNNSKELGNWLNTGMGAQTDPRSSSSESQQDPIKTPATQMQTSAVATVDPGKVTTMAAPQKTDQPKQTAQPQTAQPQAQFQVGTLPFGNNYQLSDTVINATQKMMAGEKVSPEEQQEVTDTLARITGLKGPELTPEQIQQGKIANQKQQKLTSDIDSVVGANFDTLWNEANEKHAADKARTAQQARERATSFTGMLGGALFPEDNHHFEDVVSNIKSAAVNYSPSQMTSQIMENVPEDVMKQALDIRMGYLPEGASQQEKDQAIQQAAIDVANLVYQSVLNRGADKWKEDQGGAGMFVQTMVEATLLPQLYRMAAKDEARYEAGENAVKNLPDNATEQQKRKAREDAYKNTDVDGLDPMMQAQAMWSDENPVTSAVATAAGMAADFTLPIGGAVGRGATKLAGKALGKALTKGVSSGVGSRILAMTGNPFYKVGTAAVGGGMNFATFEGLHNVVDQMASNETGDFSIGDVFKTAAHGFLTGAAAGGIGSVVGLGTEAVAGRMHTDGSRLLSRIGGKVAGFEGEALAFSLGDILDPDADGWNSFLKNQGMVAGFKLYGAARGLGRKGMDLLASKNNGNRADSRRYRNMFRQMRERLSAPAEDGLTTEEIDRLADYGYGDMEKQLFDDKIVSEFVSSLDRQPPEEAEASAARRLGRVEQFMSDENVPLALRSKVFWIATGQSAPVPPVAQLRTEGNVVSTYDYDGNLIDRRTFTNDRDRDRYTRKMRHQAELGLTELAETRREGEIYRRQMEPIMQGIAQENGLDLDILRIQAGLERENISRIADEGGTPSPEDLKMTGILREIESKAAEAYKQQRKHTADDSEHPDQIREKMRDIYGVDVDKVLAKEASERTENESEAVRHYLSELEEELNDVSGTGAYKDPIMRQTSEAMQRGRNASEGEDEDLYLQYQAAREDFAGVFGVSPEEYFGDSFGKVPVNELLGRMRVNNESPARMEAAEKLFVAWSGAYGASDMLERKAMQAGAEERARLEPTIHRNGRRYHVKLKDGRIVYVVDGKFEPNFDRDGKNINNKGDDALTIYDPDKDKRELASLNDIEDVAMPMDGNQYLDEQANMVYQRERGLMMDRLTGKLSMRPGEQVYVQSAPGYELATIEGVDPETGEVTIKYPTGKHATFDRDTLAAMHREGRLDEWRRRNREPARFVEPVRTEESITGETPIEEPVASGPIPDYTSGTFIGVDESGREREGVIESVEDGVVSWYWKDDFDRARETGENPYHESMAESFHSMVKSWRPDEVEEVEESPREAYVPQEEYAEETPHPVEEPKAGEATEEAKAEAVEEGIPAESEAPEAAEGEPIPTKTVGRKTVTDYTAVSPERAHENIYNEMELDEDEANDFVQGKLDKAVAAQKQMEKKKPTASSFAEISEYKAAKREWEDQNRALQNEVDHWQKVMDIHNSKAEEPVAETPKEEAPKAEEPKVEEPKAQTATEEPTAIAPEEEPETAIAPEEKAEASKDDVTAVAPEETPETPKENAEIKNEEKPINEKKNAKQPKGFIHNEHSERADKETVGLLDTVARSLGYSVRFGTAEEADGANAATDLSGKEIILNKDLLESKDGEDKQKYFLNTVFGHEVTHALKASTDDMPEIWDTFVGAVKGAMGDEFQTTFDKYRRIYDDYHDKNGWKRLSDADIEEEVAVEAAGRGLMTDQDFMRRVLDKVAENKGDAKGLVKRIKESIQGLINRLRRSFGTYPNNRQQRILKGLEDMRDSWEGMFEYAAAKQSEVELKETSGIDLKDNGSVRFSLRFDTTDPIRNGRQKILKESVKAGLITEKMAKDCDDYINHMEERLRNDILFGVIKDPMFLQYQVRPPMRQWNGKKYQNQDWVKTNAEYPMNVEPSFSCIKRDDINALLNLLYGKRLLSLVGHNNGDYAKLKKIAKKYGMVVTCEGCFVDQARDGAFEWAQRVSDVWNKIVNAGLGEGVATEFSNSRVKETAAFDKKAAMDVAEMYAYVDAANKAKGGNEFAYTPEGYAKAKQYLEEAGKEPKKTYIETAKKIINDPALRHVVNPNDLIAPNEYWDCYMFAHPEVKAKLQSLEGMGSPKLLIPDSSYEGEIQGKWKAGKKFGNAVEFAYNTGGVRVQSASDFRGALFPDYSQALGDLASKALPGQAYSKVVYFPRLFGMTGLKINMSLFPAGDVPKELRAKWHERVKKEDFAYKNTPEFIKLAERAGLDERGEFFLSSESFPIDEAFDIVSDERYKANCGCIMVAVSDAHYWKAAKDPHIQYIIPYHDKIGDTLGLVEPRSEQDTDIFTNSMNHQNTCVPGAGFEKLPEETYPQYYRRIAQGVKAEEGDTPDTLAKKAADKGYLVDKPSYGKKLCGGIHIKDQDGASFNLYESLRETNDPVESSKRYVELCQEKGWIPIFPDKVYDPETGEFSKVYYKLLGDWSLCDMDGKYRPQEAIKMDAEHMPEDWHEILMRCLEDQAKKRGFIKADENLDRVLTEFFDYLREVHPDMELPSKEEVLKAAADIPVDGSIKSFKDSSSESGLTDEDFNALRKQEEEPKNTTKTSKKHSVAGVDAKLLEAEEKREDLRERRGDIRDLLEKGLISEEQAKELEGQVQSELKGLRTKSEPRKYSILGTKGAASLDKKEGHTNRMDNLSIAEDQERRFKEEHGNATEEERKEFERKLKYATGWERGADGKWRYEMPDGKLYDDIDNDSSFMYYCESLPLEEVWDDENLYNAYPELRKVKFYAAPEYQGTDTASYNPDTKTISVGNYAFSQEDPTTIVHEIQHAIQDIEGFAEGGNASKGKDRYHRLGGEVEARNAASRHNMTDEERRGTLLSETEDVPRIDQLLFSEKSNDPQMFIGKKAREAYEKLLAEQRPRMSKKKRDEALDYLHSLADTKENTKRIKTAVNWLAKGSVRLPEDMFRIDAALSVAEKAKVDPMRYESPDALMNAHAEIRPSRPRINPDEVPTLTNKRELSDGIVVYDVQESEKSRMNMRDIIDTHWGEDANPWCLLARTKDKNGEVNMKQSRKYWKHYSSIPKQVAFKDGKLIAFHASDDNKEKWWDRNDRSSTKVRYTKKNVANDGTRCTAVYEEGKPDKPLYSFAGESGKEGTYKRWDSEGELRYECTNNSTGRLEGVTMRSDNYYPHASSGSEMRDREFAESDPEKLPYIPAVEYASFTDGLRHGPRVIIDKETGNVLSYQEWRNGRTNGLQTKYYEDGSLKSIYRSKDGSPEGMASSYYEDGSLSYASKDFTDRKNPYSYTSYWAYEGEERVAWDSQTGLKVRFDEDLKPVEAFLRKKSLGEFDFSGKFVPHEETYVSESAKDGIAGLVKFTHEANDLKNTIPSDPREMLKGAIKDRIPEPQRRHSIIMENQDYQEELTKQGKVSYRELDPKDEFEKDIIRQLHTEGEYITVYRTMQIIDGKLYSPMAAGVGSGKKATTTPEIKLFVPEAAEEHPELVYLDENGEAKIKISKKTTKSKELIVAYNPYIHTSYGVLNDQFTAAWNRPNLVVVECRVPKSELTSGYKADVIQNGKKIGTAKDAVGELAWHSGPVSGQLAKKGDPRRVVLSRYDMPVRVLSNREVAEKIHEQIKDYSDINLPWNLFHPEVKSEMEKMGHKFNEEASGIDEDFNFDEAREWTKKNVNPVTDEDVERINREHREMADRTPEGKQRALHTMSEHLKVPVTVLNSDEDIKGTSLYKRTKDEKERQRMLNSKGWFDHTTGEIVINMGKHDTAGDVAETILHEAVGHKGFREIFGEEGNTQLWNEVYDNLADDVRDRVNQLAGKYGYRDFAEATEEYAANLAQKGFKDFDHQEYKFWKTIRKAVSKAIAKIFETLKIRFPGSMPRINDNELRQLLWNSYDHLVKGDLLQRAEDLARRQDILDEEAKVDASFRDADDPIWGDQSTMTLRERMLNETLRQQQLHANDHNAMRRAVTDVVDNLKDLVRDMRNRQGRTTQFQGADHRVDVQTGKATKAVGKFDKETTARVQTMVRILNSNGYLEGTGKRDMAALMKAVSDAVGRDDITKQVDKVMDVVTTNMLRKANDAFGKALKIGGNRVNSKGVDALKDLDPRGVNMMEAMRNGMRFDEPALLQMITDAQNDMGSPDPVKAEEAADRFAGLNLAHEWVANIKQSMADEQLLREQIRKAEADCSAGTITKQMRDQIIQATEDAIRDNKLDRITSLAELTSKIFSETAPSADRALQWRQQEKQRIEDIHHNANSDLQGVPNDEQRKDSRIQRFMNNKVTQLILGPLCTFEQMLRQFGSKSVNGEGYLYNRFMRGWIDANQKEYVGYTDSCMRLNNKASQVFGGNKRFADINAIISKLPKMTATIMDASGPREMELDQGQLLYLSMIDKMADGRMKLRAMGIDEDQIDAINSFLDPRLQEMGRWLQEEFLPQSRRRYNATHQKVFGASMASIDSYFPLKIQKNALVREVEIDERDNEQGLGTAVTGAIKRRKVNTRPIDIIHCNAFDVLADHVREMEHWDAFAQWDQDMKDLLSYKNFRNKVMNMTTIYGGGKTLFDNFRHCAQMASGCYQPTKGVIDRGVVEVGKMVTMAKISFRMYTAFKQLMSFPAYFCDASVGRLARNSANPMGSWKWCAQNLPLFRKRWESRMSGDTRLKRSQDDYDNSFTRAVETLGKWGMSPNAAVDALTVAIGARSIYETKLKDYKRQGFSDNDAHTLAVQDAENAYNLTQQSSEGAYTATIQVDRTAAAVALSVFRNASMAYQRQLVDSYRNLIRIFTPGYKRQSLEFMAKQLERQGLAPDAAESAARLKFRKQLTHDLVRAGLNGFVLQFTWNLASYLPYLLCGDDSDKKKEMLTDAARHALVGAQVEGLTGGGVMSEAANMAVSGESFANYDPTLMPMMADVKNLVHKFGSDRVAGFTDLINLAAQVPLGVNPDTAANISTGLVKAVSEIVDACKGDPQAAREAMMAVMQVLNCPQSQIDEVYFDSIGKSGRTAQNMTPRQIAERYAIEKVKRGALWTSWAYDEFEEGKALEKKRRRANEKMRERLFSADPKAEETVNDHLDRFNREKDRIDYLKTLQARDPEAFESLYKELEQDGSFEHYNTFKSMDSNLDRYAKAWLNAETQEQAEEYALAIKDLRKQMAEKLKEFEAE